MPARRGEGTTIWVSHSFECHLTDKELVALRGKLDKLLDSDADSMRFYHICAACVAKVETYGSKKPVEESICIV